MRTFAPVVVGLPLLAGALVLGCGGEEGASEAGPTSRHGLAASDLTPLADGLIDVTLAAVRGQPIPQTAIPLAPVFPGQQLVEQDPTGPLPAASLTVVGFIMEVELVLRAAPGYPGYPTEGLFGGGDGSLDVLFLLDRSGLRLGDLSVRGPRTPRPLPPTLVGVDRAATAVLASLRDGSATGLLVHDADRVALGSDALYREIAEDRPDLARLERAKALAVTVPVPAGYGLDDEVFTLARGPDGTIWVLGLNLDQDQAGGVVLATSPLVRVRRFGARY